MGKEQTNLRRGVQRRLKFIKFRLFWEDHVNRSDLIDVFGISAQQASSDLNRYLGMAPGNMIYDKSAKTYVRASGFSPILLQLRSVADGMIDTSEAWIGQFPAFDATPTPVRDIIAKTLRPMIVVIRRSDAIEIKYQSLSRRAPQWCWIIPHAMGFDGFRWHAQAFCEIVKRLIQRAGSEERS